VVEAIRSRRLQPTLRELHEGGHDVGELLAACDAIVAATDAEQHRLGAVLARRGVRATARPVEGPDRLLHLVRFTLADRGSVSRAVDAIEAEGYRRWGPTGPAAWEVVLRTAHQVTLVRTDDSPLRVEVAWRAPHQPSRWRRLVVPNELDLSLVSLPRQLWPLAFALRPLRLVAGRVGIGRRGIPSLGPPLLTPPALARALVDLAGLSRADVVLDLGCGDGRLLVDAATRTGCRAWGVERDPQLVDRARRRAAAAGVAERVRVDHGDAATVDPRDATVVLIFLPSDVVERTIGPFLQRLRPGTRVLAHEQHPIDADPAPEAVVPLVTADGVTVVSRWTASSPTVPSGV
jgi:protein-L-isoaspartate O-methyltransferase